MPEGAPVNPGTKTRKVLPHERLFLDHLLSADGYHKSLLYYDVINLVAITCRCALLHNAEVGCIDSTST
ncbi:hypothetical protein EDB87DRAFT_1655158 [Lactarius vividus]|nr:hypothetical protein EDB87DRAFT_1655158 [Lactarius vividus]